MDESHDEDRVGGEVDEKPQLLLQFIPEIGRQDDDQHAVGCQCAESVQDWMVRSGERNQELAPRERHIRINDSKYAMKQTDYRTANR